MTTFEWDGNKASANEQKHDVTFLEATTVFDDALAASVPDVIHSQGEQRWVTIGMSSAQRVLVVVHTHSDVGSGEEVIRIISARAATPREQRMYNEG